MKFFLSFGLIALSFLATGQDAVNFYSIEKKGKLRIETFSGVYEIFYYREGVVETNYYPEWQKTESTSHAVIDDYADIDLKMEEKEDMIIVAPDFSPNGSIEIRVQFDPFELSYWYDDSLLCTQVGFGSDSIGYDLQMNISDNEVLYGGGARALPMNRRGKKLELYNRAHYGYETEAPLMNFCIPMFLSSKRYAVHFDAPGTGYLDLDSKNKNIVEFSTVSERRTYQVIAGKTWEQLLSNWTGLTGRQMPPPVWALGNFASRFGYHSQEEVESVVQQFKEDEIPLDAIILDLYWFSDSIKGTMGNLEFHKDSFPDPEGMIQGLKDQGIKTVLVTEPFILTTSNRWEEALENDAIAKDTAGNPLTYEFYFGNTGLVDVFSPQARKWFWEKYSDLKAMGIAGFWGDLGEPEVHPAEMMHATGTANEVHNIYGNRWAQMIQEEWQKEEAENGNYSDQPFILMRAGYSGAQRFGLIPWSGDVNRSWGGLQSQPGIALQMGMQGLAYMHSDLGGFAGDYEDSELYTRWLQYGVFQPIFRPHAQEEVPAEPIFWDAETKQLAKETIELRYRLLPYNIQTTRMNHRNGTPLMRPLFYYADRWDGTEIYENDSIYFWGKDFLVAPVLHKSQEKKAVYFPSGCWYDFYSGELHEGHQWDTVALTMKHIPVFVRANAFVPMVEGLQNTDAYDPNDVTIHFYHAKRVGSDTVVIDESSKGGINLMKKQGPPDFNAFRFSYVTDSKRTLIKIHNSMEEINTVDFLLHLWDGKVRKIRVNGKKIKFNKKSKECPLNDIQLTDGRATIEIK